MSIVPKKPLIKQQTVYDGDEKAKSKMSHTTKRVSFDSTTIQSDSDEENSLGRINRKPVKKPSGDDDDLLSMFRNEVSDSEDDVLQTQSKVKSKSVFQPNPVPRHLTSAAREVNEPADDLGQTINPKVKPRPHPRKMSGDIHSGDGSPRSAKPEVTPRKQQPGSMEGHEQHMNGRRKIKPRHDLDSDDDDDIVVDSRRDNHKPSKHWNKLEEREFNVKKGSRKPKKECSDEDEYIEQDIIVNNSSSTLKPVERKMVKSFQGGSVLEHKKDIDFEKRNRGMVPAPKPRKHIQDGKHDYKSHIDDDDFHSDDTEIDRDLRKRSKATIPKDRKEHLVEIQEKEIVSESISKSRLHHLDVDDDDGEETHKKMVDKGEQMPNRNENGFSEDKVDGRPKKEKSLDWSSLDESDDDEAVGKKVNLFKKPRPSSAKAFDDNNNKERHQAPKPSPRPRHHKDLGNVEQQPQHDMTDYDTYKRVPREGDKIRPATSAHTKRIATPQRPGSSKAQSINTGWGRDREKEDITNMFEEHIPDTDDLIGGHHNQFQHRKDQLRLQSSITPKKGPMRADQGIEAMTRSPHLRQALTHTDNQGWDYSSQQSLGKQKSSSLTNLHRIEDSDDGLRRNSLDTETIRQTVYDNWLSRKTVTIKKELSKKALEKQKEEEKRKEEKERKKNAQLAFQSWNQRKTETLKEQHAKKKTKQKEEQEKMELERQMKEKDSKKYFESWKSKKDAVIIETHKEKKKEDKMKKKKEEEEKLEKTMSSKKSFENWKSKKDTILKQQLKEKKKKQKDKETKKEEESYEKTIKNADEFQKWVESKGKPRKAPPPPTLTQRAWVPGSRYIGDSCIPATVQPVVLPASTNRARTMSGTYRGKTKYYDF